MFIFLNTDLVAFVVLTIYCMLQMGDPSVEVTEESRDASQEAKGQAMEAISEGKCCTCPLA